MIKLVDILPSKMIKLIDTPPLKLELNVNYIENFGTECHLLKIRYCESSYAKLKRVNVIYPKLYYTLH